MREKRLSVIAAAAMSVGLATSGYAVTVFSTGFEAGEGYTAGSLTGQNGWSQVLVSSGSTVAVGGAFNVINNASNAFSGSQYINSDMTAYANDSGSTNYKLTAAWPGDYDSSATETAGGKTHITGAVYQNLAANANKTNYTTFEVFGATLGGNVISVGINNAGSTAQTSRLYIHGGNDTRAFVISNGTTTAGTGTNTWVNSWWTIDATMDYGTEKITSLVVSNAALAYSLDLVPFLAGAVAYDWSLTPGNSFEELDMVAERDAHTGLTATAGGTTQNRFDNIFIENVVPEPTSAVALAAGFGLLAARRRRR